MPYTRCSDRLTFKSGGSNHKCIPPCLPVIYGCLLPMLGCHLQIHSEARRAGHLISSSTPACHSERSEESRCPLREILRFAQNDSPLITMTFSRSGWHVERAGPFNSLTLTVTWIESMAVAYYHPHPSRYLCR